MNTGMQELKRRWSMSSGIKNLAGHPHAASPPSWYRIVNAANRPTELYVYDEIGMWGVTSADFAHDLAKLDTNAIDLHINSPGGAANEGVAIYNALLSHPAEITSIVDGWAASAASVIAMAGKRIKMREGSLLMIHKASGGCYGTDEDMETTAEILRKVTGSIADIYTARRGGTRDEWLAAMAAETWYTPAEAVAVGLADEEETEDTPENRAVARVTGAASVFDAAAFAAALKGAWS